MFFRRSLFVLLVCGGCAADAGSSRSPQLDVDASWLRPDAGRAEPGDAGGRDAATHFAFDAALLRDAGVDAGPDASLRTGFCADSSWSPPGSAVTCETASDCPQPGSFSFACVLEMPAQCGGVAPPPPACDLDSDCGTGRICEARCGSSYCVAGCSLDSCGPFSHCVLGRCAAAARCDGQSTLVCSSATVCSPGAPGADDYGCAPVACNGSTDCPCGSCVNGQCASHPGFCYHAIPVP